MVFIQFLDFYNLNHIELVINDATAKAYWLQVDHLYSRIGWISLVAMVSLKIIYWTIEYIH